ncbi:hypothetical protein EG327_007082 [Venturia inaequalis]|uniref:Major facilitator superfamily (MFS) profile domain-containing protein n=1 Tax=Venturia inaequalis TaxID=5025 RepID=A0A8H3V2P2_VENIN|nr:hypothetical protein EG327_007082 [Venturia inaequalis]
MEPPRTQTPNVESRSESIDRRPQSRDGSTRSSISMGDEESPMARIERLGRARPEKFKSTWEEVGFCFSIVMSQVLTEYFISGFNVLLPTLAKDLNIPRASQTWPANAFSLVVACFLLTFGRLADMYGGWPVYVSGFVWLCVWSLIAGFSQNELMLDLCRAIQGFGPAAYLPASFMLLGSTYRPGPRKNIVFSIYGAAAPFGFYVGIFFAGVTAQFDVWRWFFFIGTILAAITAVTSYCFIPSDVEERESMGVRMDWLGAILIPAGLIAIVFAITDSSHAPQKWATPYIYILLIVGVLILGSAVYVEGWVAIQPLLPFDLFKVKSMTPLMIALLFSYGSLGIFLFYGTFYMTDILGRTPLQLVAWFSTSVLELGVALFLGLGDLVVTETAEEGLEKSYKNVFWVEVAVAGVALVLLVGFVKIDSAKSDMTADERVAALREEEGGEGR